MLPCLRTVRLVLAPLTERHLERFLAVAGSRAIADTTISVPHPLTEEAARAWVGRAVAESREGLAAHFALALPPDEATLIGYAAIKDIDREHNEAELSFWLGADHGGRGYATEAAGAVVTLGFETLELNRIEAYHMARNPASGRVLAKLGFHQEGCLRQRVRKWGAYEDVLLWSRLRQDPS